VRAPKDLRTAAVGAQRYAPAMVTLRMNVAIACAVAALAAPALAETSKVTPSGFVSAFQDALNLAPDAVWQAIAQLPRWWGDEHTWSGKAANMQLDLYAGGCWCERWSDGQAVMHGQVVLVQPGKLLRLYAQLGPLQELATSGVLTFTVGASEGRTQLRMSYRVAGSPEAALDKLAPLVDRVMADQFARLKAYAQGRRPG
jgi:uncharacterized protein YndB with AHSA1/START domain